MSKKRKPMRAHWYRMHIGECPVCGRDASYRRRVYGERPENMKDRYVDLSYESTYDHCLEYEACQPL